MYYKVKYDNGTTDTINISNNLQVGKVYRLSNNGRVFKVLKKVSFRYTLDDLDNLRVMLEGYEEGEYLVLFKRVMKALNKGIPNIRFSSYEKELLSMLLDHEDLPEFRKTLIKIVGEEYL